VAKRNTDYSFHVLKTVVYVTWYLF